MPDTTEPRFDPLDPADAADPYEKLAELRARCPVSHPRQGVSLVVRHDDTASVFRNWEKFSNAGGLRLEGDKPTEEQTLNEIDPPRHGPIRRQLLSALSPAIVAAAEPMIATVAHDVVGRFAARGRVDLVEEMAVPLPSRVITHMLGVPESDAEQFHAWTAAMVEEKSASGTGQRLRRDTELEFNAYILGQVRSRREQQAPPDDIITRMMSHELKDGHRLSDTEIVTQIRFLLMAGNETTTNLIANLCYELIRVPERYARVQADRALLPIAIEESLRHDSPVQLMFRTATVDTELSECPIQKGERVIVSMGAANRDENVFDEAAAFDLDRGMVTNHMAFGLGPHLCIGAPLARLQTHVLINTLMDMVTDPRLAPDFVYEKVDFFAFRGPKHLPVVFTT